MSSGTIKWEKRTSGKEAAAHFASQIKDRVVLITGPSRLGIGWDTALAIALQKPKLLILAGRSVQKLEESRNAILEELPDAKFRLLELDLSSMAQVREAAKEVNAYEENIDVLINNAGTMDNPYTLTPEGHEIQLATNYLGHWIFTNTIIQKVLDGANKRIVNVSSSGHGNGGIRWDDPDFKKGEYHKKQAYGQSKTAVNLYTIELARRYAKDGLVALSLDPGGISTPLQKHWTKEDRAYKHKGRPIYEADGSVDTTGDSPWKTHDQGASTSIRAAFDPDLASHNGEYLADCQPTEPKEWAKDPESAQRLWDWTNKLLGENF